MSDTVLEQEFSFSYFITFVIFYVLLSAWFGYGYQKVTVAMFFFFFVHYNLLLFRDLLFVENKKNITSDI